MGQAVIWKPSGFGASAGGGIQLTNDLLEELIAMGVVLDRNADYNNDELVPQILQILESSKEEYIGTLTSDNYHPLFDTYGVGDIIPLNAASTTESAVRIKKVVVQYKGIGANTLIWAGPSWTELARSNNDEAGEHRYLKLQYVPPAGGIMTLPMLRDAIDEVTVKGNDETSVHAEISLTVTTNSGATIIATGSAKFEINYVSTWRLAALEYPTFGDAVASGKTWGQIGFFDKAHAIEVQTALGNI